jgi:hypothetical protein
MQLSLTCFACTAWNNRRTCPACHRRGSLNPMLRLHPLPAMLTREFFVAGTPLPSPNPLSGTPTPATLRPLDASRLTLSFGIHRSSFDPALQLLSPAPSPMKPLPSPSRAAIATNRGAVYGSSLQQDYNPSAYSAHLHQTPTFASLRSSPPAAASLPSQFVQHELQARHSAAHQHFDDMLHSSYIQESHEAHRPASPVMSSAEAAALKMELQASARASSCPTPLEITSVVSRIAQLQTARAEQLQQQVKTLQTRRPSPQRAAAPIMPPLQLRTAADVAAHEEVRALQAALASAHARNDVLEASVMHCLVFHV